jgi:16S rRNA (cytosine967-C5)-methyltransferase
LYDLILLDAPCSSTGVIRRHPDIKHLKRKQDIDNLNVLQSRIIKSLWSLLKPGGHLLYVTCSILKKENDLVIKYFLKNNLDASKKNLLLNNNINDVMLKTEFGYQLLPGTRGMDGFYFSLLEKAAL